MIELNLLPPEFTPPKERAWKMPELPNRRNLLMALAGILVLQGLMNVWFVMQRVESHRLRGEISEFKESHRQLFSEKAETEAAQKKIREIQTWTQRKFYWTEVLNALSDSTVKGVWLRRLYLIGNELPAGKSKEAAKTKWVLKLEGSAIGKGEETALIGKFIKELKSHPKLSELFSDVALSNMTQGKIKEYDVFDFALDCNFKSDRAG